MKNFLTNWPIVFLCLSVWACGTSEPEQAEVNSEELTLENGSAYYESVLEIGLNKNSNWAKHWASAVGVFSSSDFQLVAADSIAPLEMPETNPILPSDPLYPYQFPHPEGNGTVDIYFYKVEAQESLAKPFLNPDSEVSWFRADGMKERLLFMGPSGMFEDGLWVNAQEFLVFGYFQEEEGYIPMAWLIDVENHVFRQFRLNKISKNYQAESYLNLKLKSVNLS